MGNVYWEVWIFQKKEKKNTHFYFIESGNWSGNRSRIWSGDLSGNWKKGTKKLFDDSKPNVFSIEYST